MANINGYAEICVECGQKRTCNDADTCHECEQNLRDASPLVDEDGEVWTPGGFAL